MTFYRPDEIFNQVYTSGSNGLGALSFNFNREDAVLQPGDIQAIDVSGSDYDPGKSFSLLVGTGGTLKVVDAVNVDEIAIPVQTGYNPIRITKVINDEGNTAATIADLWALF